MMRRVKLGLMGHDFGSRFDDSNHHSKGHSENKKKVRKGEINSWDSYETDL
jgi:hypothetical protein